MSYFALGAYYKYSTYGATGIDLIPWVQPLIGHPFASNANVFFVQAPRLLERSPVHGSRRRGSSLYIIPTETQ